MIPPIRVIQRWTVALNRMTTSTGGSLLLAQMVVGANRWIEALERYRLLADLMSGVGNHFQTYSLQSNGAFTVERWSTDRTRLNAITYFPEPQP